MQRFVPESRWGLEGSLPLGIHTRLVTNSCQQRRAVLWFRSSIFDLLLSPLIKAMRRTIWVTKHVYAVQFRGFSRSCTLWRQQFTLVWSTPRDPRARTNPVGPIPAMIAVGTTIRQVTGRTTAMKRISMAPTLLTKTKIATEYLLERRHCPSSTRTILMRSPFGSIYQIFFQFLRYLMTRCPWNVLRYAED